MLKEIEKNQLATSESKYNLELIENLIFEATKFEVRSKRNPCVY